MRIKIDDFNNIDNGEVFFNLNDVDILQRTVAEDGTQSIIFVVGITRIGIPFAEPLELEHLFKECMARKVALSNGKEAFARHLKQSRKALA